MKKLLLLSGVLALLPLMSTAAQAAGNDAAIKVSLSRVDASLPCDEVGDRTQVTFDARGAGFKPRQLRVLLNGEPVPAERVHDAWPRVTLDGGLLPGRNTVELIAETPDGTPVERGLVVKVGDSVHSSDGVQLACQPAVEASAAQAVAPPPQTTVVETPPAVVYAPPPAVVYSAPPPVYYGYPYYDYPPGYYYGGYYGYGGPAVSLGFSTCIGCGRHGGGWHRGWRR